MLLRIRKRISARSRRGLTLIELIVVLIILIAVAGLLVPMLPSMLTRAHTSTCSTNMGETTKAIAEYQALYSQQPNNFDAMGDGVGALINYFAGSGGPGGANPTWPVGQGAGMDNGEITGYALPNGNTGLGGANEVTNLTGVGITLLQPMVTVAGTPVNNPVVGPVFDPTFNYYAAWPAAGQTTSSVAVPIASGTYIAILDPTTNTQAFNRCVNLNLSVTGRYALFGIGQRCSMVGVTIETAPVHFGDQPALNPEYGYQHLLAIYQISDSSVYLSQARLAGVAPCHDTGIGNIQDELQNWYQLTTGGS